jgi:hypothetical protein
MSMNLFASASGDISWKEELSPGAVVLRGFASFTQHSRWHRFLSPMWKRGHRSY